MQEPISTLASRAYADTFHGDELIDNSPQSPASRFHAHTFGGKDYELDCEENLGFRTPLQDEDLASANAIFDRILQNS